MKYPLRRIYLPPFWKGEVLAASPAAHFLLLATSHDVTSSLRDRLPAVRFCDPDLDRQIYTQRSQKKTAQRDKDQKQDQNQTMFTRVPESQADLACPRQLM